jgi:hypothetical protein
MPREAQDNGDLHLGVICLMRRVPRSCGVNLNFAFRLGCGAI